MAYLTYTTKALVCGVFNRNTADRSYLLFTREAGMLYADARSVREERSRQRYALQEFSLVRVSLVKGKNSWKIGSIEAQKNYYHEARDKESRGSVVSLFRLLRRFLKGEEQAQELFNYTLASLEELIKVHTERNFLEMALQVHILAKLGYVDINNIPANLQSVDPDDVSKQYSDDIYRQIEKLYTQAVTVSHL
ncbi:recombination protein O N-terminal domain-containing protein [Candidatus Nomurabacteria bacterium]|nr:recombination protein O N-terminal domain-containing protein [Candidatus Kaiserbacteria bacterium]MCB9814361.1 recombination protein O N-terminal domain-containing protein [Candidatus Nomurabacteria bacterium]